MTKPLPEGNFALASYKTNRWSIVPAQGHTLETVLAPGFWRNVARKLRSCDIIEVHAEDGSWFAELYVREAKALEARVVPLTHYDFTAQVETAETPAAPVDFDRYEVKYRNPAARYGIVIKDTKEVLKDGFQTAEAALQYLAEYRKTMAA